MSKVRVVIATTEGPSEIDRITPEEAAQSVVCLRRSSRTLPISAAYDAFVRRPSGVIDREFPRASPGAYRLDLSATVSNGESWQLGVFIAHALAASGRLAASGEPCQRVIVATGRIDNDLRVLPVEEIAAKAQALRPLLEDLRAKRAEVRIVASPENAAAFAKAGLPDGILSRGVETAGAACAQAGIESHGGRHNRVGRWVAAATGAALVAGLTAWRAGPEWWQAGGARAPPQAPPPISTQSAPPERPTAPPEAAAPAPPPRAANTQAARTETPIGDRAVLTVAALVAPTGATCPQVHMGSATAVAVPVPAAAPPTLEPSRGRPVCGLRFTVRSESPVHVALALQVAAGRYVESMRKPAVFDGAAPLTGAQSWEIGLPSGQAFRYELLALAGDGPLADAARRGAAGQDAAAGSPGVALARVRHEVVP
jgi:hypothetical protein